MKKHNYPVPRACLAQIHFIVCRMRMLMLRPRSSATSLIYHVHEDAIVLIIIAAKSRRAIVMRVLIFGLLVSTILILLHQCHQSFQLFILLLQDCVCFLV